jgi:hypothetical protein
LEIVSSLTEDKYELKGDVLVIDDYYTAQLFHKFSLFKNRTAFYIFRSDSFCESDIYKFDFYLKVSPLESGISQKLDGNITLHGRDECMASAKYKVTDDGVFYREN